MILRAMRSLVKSDTVEAFIGITEEMHGKGRLVITPEAPDWVGLKREADHQLGCEHTL